MIAGDPIPSGFSPVLVGSRPGYNHFEADGLLPVSSIVDKGVYVQSAFYPVPRKLELYAATPQIYGDKKAGFSNSNKYLGGMNYYLANSRNHRINIQVIRVNRSPVSSTFGYLCWGPEGYNCYGGIIGILLNRQAEGSILCSDLD